MPLKSEDDFARIPVITISIGAIKQPFPDSLYSPTSGRFLSKEPTGIDGPNLYWYALNNPVNFVDPTGEFACGGICLAIGVAAITTFSYQEEISEFANNPIHNRVIRGIAFGTLVVTGAAATSIHPSPYVKVIGLGVAAGGIVGLLDLLQDIVGDNELQIPFERNKAQSPLSSRNQIDSGICESS